MENRSLYFGDNLEILRTKFPGNEGYFDLVYLDPPFNSNKNYNVLFKEGLVDSEAQIHAFEDSWHWTHEAQREFEYLVANAPEGVTNLIVSMEQAVGHNDVMAYLVMMTSRLLELHRVLKPTGSIYLHCDPTASHYLKIIMDSIFGAKNFKNEIVWKRTSAHNDPARFGRNSDRILYYTKSENYTFNPILTEYDEKYVEDFYRHKDEKGVYQLDNLTGPKVNPNDPVWKGFTPATAGRSWSIPKKAVRKLVGEERAAQMSTTEKLDLLYESGYIQISKNGTPRFKRYLDDMEGAPAQEIWTDVLPIGSQAKERLGYPTQKPEALLERIIKASSNEGDWVLDPFCGCGTTVAAAEKFKRNWVGIDISMLAVKLIERRLVKTHADLKNKIHINGLPRDMAGARALFENDPWDFEYWVAVHLLDAKPPAGKSQGNMKGADKGVDGVITLITDSSNGETEYGKVIVQVKGGHVQRSHVATLKADILSQRALGGVFISLEKPTAPMKQEAAQAGMVKTRIGEFPAIQILTVEDLLIHGKRANLPGMVSPYKQALAFNPTIAQASLL